MDFLDDKFRDILDRNETIIWSGTPNFWIWISSSVLALIIGMLWGIFDIVFSVSWLSHASPVMCYIFIPFILVHSVPCWGSVLYVIWLFLSYKNVVYACTDKRIIIRSGLLGIDYRIIDHDKINNIQVNVNPIEKLFGVGTITFYGGVMSENALPILKRFRGIEEPYEVFRRIKEVSHDAKTDWNYPNAIRPETNPGYQTKYARDEIDDE
jgi:uncharacterized membrane protein YdbT with pleckstrin-like domain